MAHAYPNTEDLLSFVYNKMIERGDRLDPIPMENVIITFYIDAEDISSTHDFFEIIYRKPDRAIGILLGSVNYDHNTGEIHDLDLTNKFHAMEFDISTFIKGMKIDG